MKRIDAAYLYEFGSGLRKIRDLDERDYKAIALYVELAEHRQAIRDFLHGSVFSNSLRTVVNSGLTVLENMNKLLIEPGPDADWDAVIPSWSISDLKKNFSRFEAVLTAELQTFALFHVAPKGGLDTSCLIDQGQDLFPASLAEKVPEAEKDVIVGAQCLAFGLWTAMAFHYHRANEAVLRKYYAQVIGHAKQPKYLTLGSMITSMRQRQVGDANIISALENIREFHRNPIAHPDQSLETDEEALSLYASVRAAIGYMLNKLPSPTLTYAAPAPVQRSE